MRDTLAGLMAQWLQRIDPAGLERGIGEGKSVVVSAMETIPIIGLMLARQYLGADGARYVREADDAELDRIVDAIVMRAPAQGIPLFLHPEYARDELRKARALLLGAAS